MNDRNVARSDAGSREPAADRQTWPGPAFPDDDGSTDAAVVDALASYEADRDLRPVLTALTRSRVLVPVVAVLAGERAADGSDKQAEMAAVLMTGRDGRNALLAFTGLEALRRWDPDARPVPVPFAQAAQAARSEGAAAVVLDIAGPVRTVVTDADLTHSADGSVLTRTDAGYVWVDRT
ncbi:SseB family protein [Solicola gregarius]|uniref:SseB family protein n=1 Tax=Solicola gregarius TaxID=2908642 RepID=A0AA46YL32_9ACTN|nr:SseB family protein [Solicola gregarius]UYM05219.1 SseB family protein [Solicola gregarius]